MFINPDEGHTLPLSEDPSFTLASLPPAPPTTVAVIESIATGAPARVVDQSEAADRVTAMFSDPEQQVRIPRVYQKTKIDSRHMAIDPIDPEFDALRRDPGTIRERMNLFYEHAVPLAVDVAGRAIAGIANPAAEIGMLVFVTSTGFIAPGVDVAVLKQLGLSPTISRVVVNFMGCAAAMNGIRTASDYVRANPAKKAVVICIELCSVNAVFADDINDVIIHSLFGDGCGAVVVGASGVQHPQPAGNIVIRNTFTRLLDDAEDGIVLGVNHNGITCELSVNLPNYIFRGVDPAIAEVLENNGLEKSDIDLWAIHPGGPKIIEESVHSLGLDPEAAAVSWDVLAEYGNMLSVSLIFVLERMAAEQATSPGALRSCPPPSTKPISTGVAFSFAPGVAIEGLLFDIVRG